jgi:2',3'-cyclic-nucleotide 2'-phosphodiesterase (5'-nucleotidase family)
MITERMQSKRVSSYVFDDPLETAAALVPELRPKADLLVALTHIGLQQDRELAQRVPGVDIIVGGHTHALLKDPEIAGSTAIVQAGWFAHYIGRTHVEFGDGRVVVREEIIEL